MNRVLGKQAAVFLVVGGIVFVADYAAYALVMTTAATSLVTANVIGRLTGAGVGFVLHRRYTFPNSRSASGPRQARRYAALFLANLTASSAMLWVAVIGADVDPFVARFLIDILSVVGSFFASRNWVFRAA